MAFEAKVFRVLIASPSDVSEEREIAVRTIQEWNDLHSHDKQIVLLPLRWESHTSPEYGKRPQEIINRQIVEQCDFLVGVFWSKIGTPTGSKESGTIEEIDKVANSNKAVMLYFSNAKKDLEDIDIEQLAKLREFKKRTYPNALVENFSTQVEFRDKLSRQLERQVRQLIQSGDAGQDSGGLISDIEMSFFDLEKKEKNGKKLTINNTYFEMSNLDEVPDYTTDTKEDDWSFNNCNNDYYRDLVDFFVTDNLLSPIKFCMENKGSLGAKDIYVSIKIDCESGDLFVISDRSYDNKKAYKNHSATPFFDRAQHNAEISKSSKSYTLSFELNALQPKRIVNSNLLLYVGTTESTKITIQATIYADSLSEPVSEELIIDSQVKAEKIKAIELFNKINKT